MHVSKRLRINVFITGFLILAVASSLPEAFVAINAASTGQPGLSVGNLVGATVIILTLVIGLSAVKTGGVKFKGMYSTKEVLMSLAIIYSQIIALIDGKIEWIEGVVLISIYAAFVIYIIGKSKAFEATLSLKSQPIGNVAIKGVIGVAGLIVFSNLTVTNTLSLATLLNVPPILLGLLVLSIGTNLPELVILFRSDSKEKDKLAAGNFIGSATINTAVLGLLALISPTVLINFRSLIPALILLSITIFIFSLMVINDKEITRREGYLLIALYVIYVATEVFINQI